MEKNHNCSFCGKGRNEVKKLIAGPNVFICDECVNLSNEVLHQENKDNFLKDNLILPSPKQIKTEFDKYVIGQDDAKRILSVVVYNHYKQLYSHDDKNEIEFGKSNVLMIGPTSSGKTLLIRVLKKIMQNSVPIAFADATTLTEAGYVGEDVESILLRLLQEADFDVEKAKRGIVFIDEIDKIALRSGGPSISRDVSGEGVQQALLGILQGKIANVSPQGGRRQSNHETIAIDTTNILFICAGAFSGLEKILDKKSEKPTLGFHGEHQEKSLIKSYSKVEPEDLIQFGMIPEFLGRLPVITTLDDLNQEQLARVLTEPKNALIKQYEKIFKINGATLIITNDAIQKIAELAIQRQVGARGLRSIIENLVQDVLFELEDHVPCQVTIDSSVVSGESKPLITKEEIKLHGVS